MTTQNVQKRDTHLNIFAKNQGRAAALPCPTGSFAPGSGQFRAVDAVEKDKSGHPGAISSIVLCRPTFSPSVEFPGVAGRRGRGSAGEW
jgi:hypothetical protein